MQKILESRIEQVHKILEQNKEEWQTTYDKQADVITYPATEKTAALDLWGEAVRPQRQYLRW